MSTTSTVCTYPWGYTVLLHPILGGQVVHSYGRLIFNERVITDKRQLQPPNSDSGDGRIECRVSSGEARFSYHGRTVSIGTSGDVHQIRSGSTATVVIRDRAFNNFMNFEGNRVSSQESESDVTAVIRDRAFNNFVNFEGNCAHSYHYLFLSYGEQYIVCGQILNTCNKHVVFDILIVYI